MTPDFKKWVKKDKSPDATAKEMKGRLKSYLLRKQNSSICFLIRRKAIYGICWVLINNKQHLTVNFLL